MLRYGMKLLSSWIAGHLNNAPITIQSLPLLMGVGMWRAARMPVFSGFSARRGAGSDGAGCRLPSAFRVRSAGETGRSAGLLKYKVPGSRVRTTHLPRSPVSVQYQPAVGERRGENPPRAGTGLVAYTPCPPAHGG